MSGIGRKDSGHGGLDVLMRQWYRALDSRSSEDLGSMLTEDAVAMFCGGPAVHGRDEVVKALPEHLSPGVRFEIQELRVSGRLAFARVAESAEIAPATTRKGLYVYFHDDENQWRIARFISNLDQPPR